MVLESHLASLLIGIKYAAKCDDMPEARGTRMMSLKGIGYLEGEEAREHVEQERELSEKPCKLEQVQRQSYTFQLRANGGNGDQ